MKKTMILVLGILLLGCGTTNTIAPKAVSAASVEVVQEEPAPAPIILTVQDIQTIIAAGLQDIRAKGYTAIGVEWNARVIWIEGTDSKGELGLGAYNLRPLVSKYLEEKAKEDNESKSKE